MIAHLKLAASSQARRRAGASGGAWDPSSLTSVVAWWRADLGHSYSDGGAVASWLDQISSIDLSQATGSRQPTYDEVNASFNNQATINFASDVLTTAANLTFWELTADDDDLSLIVVVRNTAAGANDTIVQTQNYNTMGGFQMLANSGGNSRWYVYGSGGSPSRTLTFTGVVQNTVHVIAGLITGATTPSTDTIAVRLDGTASASGSTDIDIIEASTNRALCVGGGSDTSGNADMELAEIILTHSNLTSGEETSLASYLNTRYSQSWSNITQ